MDGIFYAFKLAARFWLLAAWIVILAVTVAALTLPVLQHP